MRHGKAGKLAALSVTVLCLAAAVGCSGGTAPERTGAPFNGLIVLIDDDGGLRVVDADGRNERAIDPEPTLEATHHFALESPGMVLVADESGELALVDATDAVIVRLNASVEGSMTAPYTDLVDGPQQKFTVATSELIGSGVLIDIEARRATDLDTATGVDGLFAYELSPDERWLAGASRRESFLLRTDDPDEIHRVDGAVTGFCDDGRSVLILRVAGDHNEMVRMPVPGGDEEILEQRAGLYPAGVIGDKVLVSQREELGGPRVANAASLIDLDGHGRTAVDLKGELSLEFVSADGTVGFVYSKNGESERWYRLDARNGEAAEVTEIAGLNVLARSDNVVLLGPGDSDQAVAAGRIVAVQRKEHEIAVRSIAFEGPDGAVFPSMIPSPDPDTFAFAFIANSGRHTALVDVATGVVRVVDGIIVAWARDGRSLLVNREIDDREQIVMVSETGSDRVDLGRAKWAVWTNG